MTGESRPEMAHAERRYQYRVVRDLGGPRYADVALVRSPAPDGVLERLLHRQLGAILAAHNTPADIE